jgi:thiamine-monophosphate kinase
VSEFKFIYSELANIKNDDSVALGVGDDAAVINPPEGYQLVQTMDTMVEHIHFDERFDAKALAHKLLHVNLSDIAAMGAIPKWATISLATPHFEQKWLSEFAIAIQKNCQEYGVNLIGGDTTKTTQTGPLTVTLNLTGIVKQAQSTKSTSQSYLTRSNAQIGDDIYVSGTLGDAALALTEAGFENSALCEKLLYPEAQVVLGQQLLSEDIANSCLDISDGLLADLNHICRQSQAGVGQVGVEKVSADITVENVPISTAYKAYFSSQQLDLNWDFALNGGDDYQLCFTANADKRKSVESLAENLGVQISRIGRITPAKKLEASHFQESINLFLHGELYVCQRTGWEHA